MNFGKLIVVGMMAVALSARADETFATFDIGSEHYTRVTITTVTASDIYFTYQGGMRNAKLADLSPALQQHFHYNPAKAIDEEQAQVLASAKYYQSLLNAPIPANSPPADASALALLPKLPGGLAPQIYLDGFVVLAAVFFLTNIGCYISGRRSSRMKQRLERLDAMPLLDLSDAAMRQIASNSKRL